MCGAPIPDDQGSNTCSMCYGDIGHGKDGYYQDWAEQQQQGEWIAGTRRGQGPTAYLFPSGVRCADQSEEQPGQNTEERGGIMSEELKMNGKYQGHMSDCATNNGPALPVGPCDCGCTSRAAPVGEAPDAGLPIEWESENPEPCALCGKPSTHICHCPQCMDMLELDGDNPDAGRALCDGCHINAVNDYMQPLWDLMHQEHGLIPVESEMQDIMACCAKIEAGQSDDAPMGEVRPECNTCNHACVCRADYMANQSEQCPYYEPPQPAMDWQAVSDSLRMSARNKIVMDFEDMCHVIASALQAGIAGAKGAGDE